jgi:hypothetical protein
MADTNTRIAQALMGKIGGTGDTSQERTALPGLYDGALNGSQGEPQKDRPVRQQYINWLLRQNPETIAHHLEKMVPGSDTEADGMDYLQGELGSSIGDKSRPVIPYRGGK